MKCKVCGRELDPQKSYCDKCGTPVGMNSASSEFSWNTIDFPKPKAVHDIDMQWGEGPKPAQKTSADLSEGFVTHKQPEPKTQTQPQQVFVNPQPQPQPQQPAAPQTVQYVQAPMTWTMPSAAWNMPQPQQVVIPQPYNVQPQVVQTQTPVISAMPQMPAQIPAQMYTQPLYVTQPMPVVQVVQAPAPAPVQTQANIDYKQAYSDALDHTVDPRVNKMPVAPAAVKNPVNVDTWLDTQLENATPVSNDKFFTFHKKNEDFQKLLDEEYQRYKNKYDTNAESLKQTQILTAAEVIQKAKDEVRPVLDDVRRADRSSANYTKPSAPTQTMVFDGNALKKAAAKYNASKASVTDNFFNGEPITEFDKMLQEGTTDANELGDSTLAISNAQLRKEINDVAKKVEEAYGNAPVKANGKKETPAVEKFDLSKLEAYDKAKRKQQLENMASARDSFFNREEEELDEETKSNQELKSIFDEWDKERQISEERKPRKKSRFGKFIFTVIFLIALFAAVDMTCLKFLPGKSITTFFENVNYKILELYGQVTGKEVVKPEENPTEQTAQEKAAASVNKNIEIITFDTESSKFVSTGEYGINNLGSKTVETDETIICELTKVIVAYNSSWVDYVNVGEDISCFDYLKTDGEAFREASNFNRLGKQEVFKKLNIGEMRKDNNFYYVFSSELIRVTIGNTTNDVPDNIIYKMALVGDVYKIVECVSYN